VTVVVSASGLLAAKPQENSVRYRCLISLTLSLVFFGRVIFADGC